jgi:beta-glucosidase
MVYKMYKGQLFPKTTPKPVKRKRRSNFNVGFANCGYQAWGRKGGGISDWTDAADKQTVPEPGYSYNHYDNYEADLDIMAAGGANCYRISIDWADMQDEHGRWLDKGINFYKGLFAACTKRDLKVMATMLHFTQPKWFTDKGGFEKEENIRDFVAYGKKMMELFGDDVDWWCTINEPAIQAFSGYLYSEFPPHKRDLQLTVDVLLNLLKAHVALYKEVKRMRPSAQVGIVHNVMRFKPRFPLEPVEAFAATYLTELFDDLVMNFFRTGTFHYEKTSLPYKLIFGSAYLHYEDLSAVGAMDFIGLNFYANAIVGLNSTNFFGPTCFPGQKMGDLALTVDPAGLGAAIEQCAALNKPVMITELGVADTSDVLREELLRTCLAVVDDKRKHLAVLALFFWTFRANYEWPHGFYKLFGMYRNDGSKMESALLYEDYMHLNGWLPEETLRLEEKLAHESSRMLQVG